MEAATLEPVEVTTLDVLTEARRLAEEVGAVEHGQNFFEVMDGERRAVVEYALAAGVVKPEEVCGVCIAGACALAEVVMGVKDGGRPFRWVDQARDAAWDVLGDADDPRRLTGPLTIAIDNGGTPYVLAVLDRMIEREAAAA